MAFDWNASGLFSGRPNHDLFLYVRRDQTDAGNNRSSYAWELRARRLSGATSYELTAYPWAVNLGGGNYWEGTHSLDFRSTSQIVIASGVSGWISHAPDGSLSLFPSAAMGPAGIFGSANLSGTFVTDSLARPPAQVPGLTFSNVTTTNIRVTATIPANNGSPITKYQFCWSKSPSMSPLTACQEHNGNILDVTPLDPGTAYSFQGRAFNAAGWGPWSPVRTQSTLPATPPGMTVTPSANGASATVALTPPGGVSGVQSYTVERRLLGSTSATSVTSPSSPITVTGLTPGATYQWRALATIGGNPSPWTDWVSVFQPNPSTNPGDYFDGSTADKPDIDHQWTGTVNNSTSIAVGKGVAGWSAAFGNGAAGLLHQVTGGYVGSFGARAVLTADATAAPGLTAGMDTAAAARAAVEAGATYFGSVWVYASRAQRLRPQLVFYTAADAVAATVQGDGVAVPAGQWIRLVVSGAAPATATSAIVRVQDVTGDSWSVWRGGDWLVLDAAMVTLTTLFAYFDGSTPDTASFDYAWLGTAHASASSRTTLQGTAADPLADPDCDPVPVPPRPPAVPDPCITTTGIWRRYWATIPGTQVSEWLTMLPNVEMTTGDQDIRQVRIRVYPNPFQYPTSQIEAGAYCAELIISYIPARTVFTLDAALRRAWAAVGDAAPRPADHLLYGTGGTPATWPELSCGIDYLLTFDVPTDAPEGNLAVQLSLTQRT